MISSIVIYGLLSIGSVVVLVGFSRFVKNVLVVVICISSLKLNVSRCFWCMLSYMMVVFLMVYVVLVVGFENVSGIVSVVKIIVSVSIDLNSRLRWLWWCVSYVVIVM